VNPVHKKNHGLRCDANTGHKHFPCLGLLKKILWRRLFSCRTKKSRGGAYLAAKQKKDNQALSFQMTLGLQSKVLPLAPFDPTFFAVLPICYYFIAFEALKRQIVQGQGGFYGNSVRLSDFRCNENRVQMDISSFPPHSPGLSFIYC
jgi:hypothetical protein